MNLIDKIALAHDDVHMIPLHSDVPSRTEVDTSVKFKRTDVVLKLPIISSPMDSVSGPEMAKKLWALGGMSILHRYLSISEQAAQVLDVVKSGAQVGAAIGVGADALERAEAVLKAGAALICVDVAHGDHVLVKQAIENLRKKFPKIHIMAGNVGSAQGAKRLASWGADSIRVGIGSGSICSTRLKTGHGYPVMQTLFDIDAMKYDDTGYGLWDTQIIADGGHRIEGDIAKSIGAGAHFVILGSMLAGTEEAPGEVIERDGKKYKIYRGMASPEAQIEWRGFFSSDEGISVEIPFKGPVEPIVKKIQKGLVGGFAYSGATKISEYHSKATFGRVSQASAIEATTHILGAIGG